jgi:hypothetical protein
MKAQAGIEFLVLVSLLLLIFAFVMWNGSSLQNQLNFVKMDVEAKNLCDKIAFEINSAVRSGDGFNRKFYVETNIFGVSDFDIKVGNYSAFINWERGSVASSIIIENITGNVNKGVNFIENRNEKIYVTQV